MQTFLPFASILNSLRCLDNKRLGKQRVEAFQLLCALDYYPALEERKRRLPDAPPLKKGWRKHPAAVMWERNTGFLTIYYNECINEWISRGFKNTLNQLEWVDSTPPVWWGNNAFHLSHQSNLLRKDYNHYIQYFKDVPLDLPYVWPFNEYEKLKRKHFKLWHFSSGCT